MEWKRSNYSTFGNSICDASIFIPFPNAGIIFRAIHLSVVRRLGCKSSAPSLPNVYPSPTRANWILVPVSDYHTLVYTTGTSRVGRRACRIYVTRSRSRRRDPFDHSLSSGNESCRIGSVKQISSSHFCRWSMHPNSREKPVVLAFVALSSRERIFYGDEGRGRRGWIGSLGVMDCLLWWRGN